MAQRPPLNQKSHETPFMRTVTFPTILRIVAALVGLLAAASPALAEKPKVKITAVRVGLPPGGRATDRDDTGAAVHICKFAAWAPVYVDLEILDPVKGPAELLIETPDADEITTTLTVPLRLDGLTPGQAVTARDLGVLPYIRPSASSGETTLTVRTAKGSAISEPFRLRTLHPKDTLTYVVLSLGNRLPGFELPRPQGAADSGPGAGLRNGRVELASITEVGMLPDQWFGYDGADLVVLTTGSGSDDFLERLFGENGLTADKLKRAALLEWVRRGGRLVVSAGSNAALVSRMPALQELLPYSIKTDAPGRAVPQLLLHWGARERLDTIGTLRSRGGTVPAANLAPKPNRAGRIVIPTKNHQENAEPIAVQAGYGLGRVTLIGFDLDRSPFTDLDNRAEFWDWVLRECGSNRASTGSETRPHANSYGGLGEEEDELAAAIRTHIDTFDGVPVISFGWVAVFIVLYILLIGPVEYFFLKKILGRLELTWVTFPLIVVTVSAAAYFTAYAVKGRDLKVNKVDVVDVVAEFDPRTGKPGGRVYGTTWFTVFSPRIDTYSVGVTPGEGWTDTPDEARETLVGWVGGPRGGRASLIRRRYTYHIDPETTTVANGLEDVPIQVWSTKSFTASYAARMNPNAPVVESRLEHPPGDPTAAIGTFVNRMPFEQVTECVAFYNGQAYQIGTILKGQEVRLLLDKGESAAKWLQDNAQLGGLVSRSGSIDKSPVRGASAAAAATTAPLPLWGLLFHESALRNDAGVLAQNASLRRLDQSWRLTPDNRDEVIVVGRVSQRSGSAEELIGGSASPSRLWLKGLPGAGKPRAAIPGTARQEIYVRLFLPVRAAR